MNNKIIKRYKSNINRARFSLYLVAIIATLATLVQFMDIAYLHNLEIAIMLFYPISFAILGFLSHQYPSVAFLLGAIQTMFFLLLNLINLNFIGFFFFTIVGAIIVYGFLSSLKLKRKIIHDDDILDSELF